MKYEQISKNWKTFLNEQTTQPVPAPAAPARDSNAKLQTYGDIQNILQSIRVGKLSKFAISLIPGGEIILNALKGDAGGALDSAKQFGEFYKLLKGIYFAKDDKKTGTWLDKLNMDDQYSAVVDDKLEQAFLYDVYQMIKSKKPNDPLPPNYSITKELEAYVARKYGNRTLTGGDPSNT